MSKKSGLGKGLGAFGLGKNTQAVLHNNKDNKTAGVNTEEPAAKEKAVETPQEIPLADIKFNPHQPRTEFDAESLEALSSSIKQYGILQPILVRRTPKGYELIAGERRCRAAEMAGLKKVPVVIREYNDAQMTEVALIENIQRENLNPIEEAQAYQHLLLDYGLTQEMLSNKVGRSRPHIANFLRLLKLAPAVQKLLADQTISMGQAKPLIAIEDEALQPQAAEFIIVHELSVRKVEALVKHLLKNPDYFKEEQSTETKDVSPEDLYFYEAEDKLKLLLGTTVRIKHSGKKKRLEIDFASQEELSQLIELLQGNNQQNIAAEAEKEDKLQKLRAFSTTGKFSV